MISLVATRSSSLTLPFRFHVPQNRETDLVREKSLMLSSALPRAVFPWRTERREHSGPNR